MLLLQKEGQNGLAGAPGAELCKSALAKGFKSFSGTENYKKKFKI